MFNDEPSVVANDANEEKQRKKSFFIVLNEKKA